MQMDNTTVIQSSQLVQMKCARLIAFYLPQFHPIKENDEWWSKGFTEWNKVAQAKPLFRGHYQPRIPTDLGFYDLRVPETRIAQAEMARKYGIEGFCYWHYWFSGKRLLERPFNEVLKSKEPDFPFCLAWANVDWTGQWAGEPNKILMKQDCSSVEDFERHFNYLVDAFTDTRYITINGKPLFYIHRPHNIPNVKKLTDYWRELAHKYGLKGLHLVGNNISENEVEELGFDAYSTHYPNWPKLANNYQKFKYVGHLIKTIRKTFNMPAIYDYSSAVIDNFPENYKYHPKHYPLVISNWDNTPRVAWQGVVLKNSSPESFRIHLKKVLKTVQNQLPEQRIVFLKSWNEWAEGNYVEPDHQYGNSYLEVIKDEVYYKE